MTPSFNGRGIGVRVVTEAKYNVNRFRVIGKVPVAC